MILDEPTAALGVKQTRNVLALIRTLAARGAAVILISHDIETVLEMADRVVVLRLGRVIHEGSTSDLTHVRLVHLMAGLAPDADVAAPGDDCGVERRMKSLASLSLEGRRALVTGAGTGIGKQIALGFGEAGAEVVLVGRTRAYLDETASELAAGGAVGIVIPADVTVEDDVQRIAAEAGQVDILLQQRGGRTQRPVADGVARRVACVLRDQRRRAVPPLQLFAPSMMERGWGRIINISSVYGKMGGNPALYPGLDWDVASYFASKHAVHGITHYLAPRLAPYGVCINSLSPGGFSGSKMNEESGMVTDEMMRRSSRRCRCGASAAPATSRPLRSSWRRPAPST